MSNLCHYHIDFDSAYRTYFYQVHYSIQFQYQICAESGACMLILRKYFGILVGPFITLMAEINGDVI
jgi:hypothetical protein